MYLNNIPLNNIHYQSQGSYPISSIIIGSLKANISKTLPDLIPSFLVIFNSSLTQRQNIPERAALIKNTPIANLGSYSQSIVETIPRIVPYI